jgi:dTDP-4-dehydrorhamnose 3,5-epimerase
MILEPLAVAKVFLVRPARLEDDRGFFARTWCAGEFAEHGLEPSLSQCSISFNKARGILRGLHYQAEPHAETKLVRCTRGAVFDVVVDLRPASPTYLRHCTVTLTADNRDAVYVPQGCAHGFLTLEDESEVLYQISSEHVPSAARGVRWDDPTFGIPWPIAPDIIADRDRSWPLL